MRYARAHNPTATVTPASPAPPKIWHVAGWIMRDPENLSDKDCLRLKEILARCPELDATRQHVGSFACLVRNLSGDRWAHPAMERRPDRGHGSKIKLLKRMAFGRAEFPLLRRRILYVT